MITDIKRGNKMSDKTKKPESLIDDHLIFLDELRESGVTNMYGSAPYLRDEFPDLSKKESYEIVAYWMQTFSERHKKEKPDVS